MEKNNIKCGIEYSIGTKAPVRSKYALYYHGFVKYYTTKSAADKAMNRLDYYSRNDAEVSKIIR